MFVFRYLFLGVANVILCFGLQGVLSDSPLVDEYVAAGVAGSVCLVCCTLVFVALVMEESALEISKAIKDAK